MSEELIREVDEYGNVTYYNKEGQLHRLDGPAYEGSDGTKTWCQNGKRHRLDGPAVEWGDGSKFWWLNGKYYRTEEEWLDARCPSIEEAREMFKDLHT
jgi:hypothetical protein